MTQLHLTGLRGCEDEEQCERHRALAGQHQLNVVKMMLSMAIPLWLGGGTYAIAHLASLRVFRAEAPSAAVTHVRIYSAQNFYTVRDAPDSGGAGDTVVYQEPRQRIFSDESIGTWTLLVRASGQVEIRGNRTNFWREYWRFANRECYSASSKGLLPLPGALAVIPSYVYISNTIWTMTKSGPLQITIGDDKWSVSLKGPHDVEIAGPLSDNTVAFWRKLASVVPTCHEPS